MSLDRQGQGKSIITSLRRALSVVFLAAFVCSSQIDERSPATALERAAKLLSSLDPLKDTARNEGGEGRLVFRLTVTQTGSVRDPIMKYPTQLADSEKIKARC